MLVGNEEIIKQVEELAKKENLDLFKISAVTGQGVEELIDFVTETLKQLPKEELTESEEKVIYTLEEKENDWSIKKEDGVFIVSGKAVERLMGRINIEDNESMYYLQKSLKNMGIEEELKKMGVKMGDTVILADWELEWYE